MLDATVVGWSALGFLLGAIPFSVLLAKWLGGDDPRRHGDRNPGAFNAWRAAGPQAGVPAILLDFFKGAIPVALAIHRFQVSGAGTLPVALAPVVGHAFSPFLRFRGGKALAVTFGIWAGLTWGEAALVLGLLFTLFYFTVRGDSWAVMLGMAGLLLYLLFQRSDAALLTVWVGNTALLAWTLRRGLRQLPSLRSIRRKPGTET